MNDVIHVDPFLEYENEFDNILSLNDSGSSAGSLLRGVNNIKS